MTTLLSSPILPPFQLCMSSGLLSGGCADEMVATC
jgi:hypothetical protein